MVNQKDKTLVFVAVNFWWGKWGVMALSLTIKDYLIMNNDIKIDNLSYLIL